MRYKNVGQTTERCIRLGLEYVPSSAATIASQANAIMAVRK